MAAPLLFLLGGTLLRAASPTIARQLVKFGAKKATGKAAQGTAKNVTSNNIGVFKTISSPKSGGASTASKTAPKTPPKPKTAPKTGPKPKPKTKPKDNTLRANSKDRLSPSTTKPKEQPSALGTKTQRNILAAGTLATFLPLSPPEKDKTKAKRTGMADRKTKVSNAVTKAAQESLANKAKTQGGSVLSEIANKAKNSSKAKSWKDYKSVSAAQKGGSDYFMGRDGKKKVAVTKEQLGTQSLTAYANKLKTKGKK